MATVSACIMGANYMTILSMFGCCGVTDALGLCKSEAAKCALSMFGAHESAATKLPHPTSLMLLAKPPFQFVLTM